MLPPDLALSLTANPRPGDLTADVLLEGGGSRIHFVLGATKGAHLRSKLEGAVTTVHATTLFSLSKRAPGVGLSGDPLLFDLALVGSAAAPSLIGTVGAGRLVVAHDGRSLSLESAEAHVHVTPAFVAFHDLRASMGQGFLRGAGVVLLVDGQPSARASFVSENIRIGRTELFPEGAPIDGRAFAHAEVRHGATGTHGELRVRVEGPTYGFLPKATARLAKLGLPQVPTSGDAALEAHAHFSPGLVRVADLRASVPGLRAHASGESRENGEILVVDVRVTVERAWLSRSAMFALPGLVLGSVEVPVSVRGSVARPETRSALAKAIFTSLSRGLFSRKTIGPLKALGPASIFIPKSPYADGSDDATHLQALVGGTLPQVDLAALARRFIHEGTTTS